MPLRPLAATGPLCLSLALMLAAGGCGGSGPRPLAIHSGPQGCSRHLVFAREGAPTNGMVALSFDDSPGPHTEEIVRTLLGHGAKATFFVIGDRVGPHARLLRAMAGEGMELGNHSYSHPRNLATEGAGASRELQLGSAAIRQASGFQPCLFRPPYGQLTPNLVQRAKEAGLTTAKWNVDPEDWRHPGADAIRERVLAGARPGSIVVLHDNVESRGQTLQALPAILDGLRARGMRPVTISELLGDTFTRSGPA
jgi:peptidoglycan/xylan/chitin deacetylase (PgdA/CDA1 family)